MPQRHAADRWDASEPGAVASTAAGSAAQGDRRARQPGDAGMKRDEPPSPRARNHVARLMPGRSAASRDQAVVIGGDSSTSGRPMPSLGVATKRKGTVYFGGMRMPPSTRIVSALR